VYKILRHAVSDPLNHFCTTDNAMHISWHSNNDLSPLKLKLGSQVAGSWLAITLIHKLTKQSIDRIEQ
jgi:hypothetical protein